MPQRQSARRFDASEVQGEGSWVTIRSMTVAEVLASFDDAQRQAGFWYRLGRFVGRVFKRRPSQSTITRRNMANVIGYVTGWNWVDDHGEPLPLPGEDASVMDRLSIDEMNFLSTCVRGARQSEEQKN